MKDTRIGWCDDTVNLWWGCEKVSPACLHCYAETVAKLFGRGRATWGADGKRWIRAEKAFAELDSLQRIARHTAPRRVFINSMSDTFEDRRDLEKPRAAFFSFVDRWPDLRLLLLTKRPENVSRMVPPSWLEKWPVNVWLGTTVEDQARANERLPALQRLFSAYGRIFLSCEPMLERIDLFAACFNDPDEPDMDVQFGRNHGGLRFGVDWVICGGESGGQRRALDLDAAAHLQAQCRSAGVPFFMKQDSSSKPGQRGRIPDDLWVQELPPV